MVCGDQTMKKDALKYELSAESEIRVSSHWQLTQVKHELRKWSAPK